MSNCNENNKTRLTLQMGDDVASWETVAPCNDVCIDEIINAFYSQLINFGYSPNNVLESLRDWAEYQLGENEELENYFDCDGDK